MTSLWRINQSIRYSELQFSGSFIGTRLTPKETSSQGNPKFEPAATGLTLFTTFDFPALPPYELNNINPAHRQ